VYIKYLKNYHGRIIMALTYKAWKLINETFGTIPLGLARPQSVGIIGSHLEEGEFGKPAVPDIDEDEDEEEDEDDVPTDDIPTDDVPTDDIPTDDVPTDDIPTDDMPTDDIPTDDMPTDDMPPEEGESAGPSDADLDIPPELLGDIEVPPEKAQGSLSVADIESGADPKSDPFAPKGGVGSLDSPPEFNPSPESLEADAEFGNDEADLEADEDDIDADEDDIDADEDDIVADEEDEDEIGKQFMSKDEKCCTCDKHCSDKCLKNCPKCSKCSNENAEEDDFFASLTKQASVKRTWDDGMSDIVKVEDALYALTDPNIGVVKEPQPGEAGFAPQARIGGIGNGYTQADIAAAIPTLAPNGTIQ
jgi:hypothetical protein